MTVLFLNLGWRRTHPLEHFFNIKATDDGAEDLEAGDVK